MYVGGVKELMSNPVVKSADEKFEKEYERAKRDFTKNAETKGEVITGVLDSRMKRLCSALSTNLSIEHKGKLIIIFEKRGERFKISARWQNGRVHLGKLMEKCCQGGGHRNAAGGSVGSGELESFKARLFRELGVK
jgi:single-stranded DNA-specific DHH superfamily exonuclease